MSVLPRGQPGHGGSVLHCNPGLGGKMRQKRFSLRTREAQALAAESCILRAILHTDVVSLLETFVECFVHLWTLQIIATGVQDQKKPSPAVDGSPSIRQYAYSTSLDAILQSRP